MKIFLNYHKQHYPKMQNQDKVKLIYQATLGPAHFSNNAKEKEIYKYILKEYKIAKKDGSTSLYYEYISSNYIRVYVQNELNLKYLAKSFFQSMSEATYNINALKSNLDLYLSEDEKIPNYDFKPIHHSSIYNEEYKPHYRLINTKYLTSIMRFYQFDLFLKKCRDHSIIALEGKCASGKTTLSENFENNYTIIHTDDFFLNEDKRTKERLDEIGGNIDYELIYETLNKIKKAWEEKQKSVTISKYSCETNTYSNVTIDLKEKVILEGVYSSHPYFKELVDKCAYLYVSDETQLNRIALRKMRDRFINEWIPLENKYFDKYDILSTCDIII